ncbi:MAG: corrinoid protein, partial [Nitrososphaerota archaeon]
YMEQEENMVNIQLKGERIVQNDILKEIQEALLSMDIEKTLLLTRRALEQGLNPIKIIEDGLSNGIRKLGNMYENGEAFLPELVMGAEIMKRAVEIVKPELEKRKEERKKLGKVMLATVEGDVHDIGKNLVSLMLWINGFEIIDLGVDVPAREIIKKIKELKPDVLGLSALLTTTLLEQKRVLEELEKAGLRKNVKVIVGGAPVTEEWAKKIGADSYAPDAVKAVDKVKELLKS